MLSSFLWTRNMLLDHLLLLVSSRSTSIYYFFVTKRKFLWCFLFPETTSYNADLVNWWFLQNSKTFSTSKTSPSRSKIRILRSGTLSNSSHLKYAPFFMNSPPYCLQNWFLCADDWQPSFNVTHVLVFTLFTFSFLYG